jgi:molybdopterin-biosynthesis enzyme MoeA-like protein
VYSTPTVPTPLMLDTLLLLVTVLLLLLPMQVQAFDVVITSGGVGPTHDDVTIYAVASGW